MTEEERSNLRKTYRHACGGKIYCVESNDEKYFIAAAIMRVEKLTLPKKIIDFS